MAPKKKGFLNVIFNWWNLPFKFRCHKNRYDLKVRSDYTQRISLTDIESALLWFLNCIQLKWMLWLYCCICSSRSNQTRFPFHSCLFSILLIFNKGNKMWDFYHVMLCLAAHATIQHLCSNDSCPNQILYHTITITLIKWPITINYINKSHANTITFTFGLFKSFIWTTFKRLVTSSLA